jgi:hypothetical protein
LFTAPGMFPSPPALNRNGRDATLGKLKPIGKGLGGPKCKL